MQSIDLHRSPQQLLEELRVASSRAIEDRNPAHMTVTFAVLLVKLSEQAEYATRRLVRLTWALFCCIGSRSAFVSTGWPCGSRNHRIRRHDRIQGDRPYAKSRFQ